MSSTSQPLHRVTASSSQGTSVRARPTFVSNAHGMQRDAVDLAAFALIDSMKKKVLLSWSGGKDSAWALHLLRTLPVFADLEVVALVTTLNERFRRVAIHGFREALLDRQAELTGLPLWKVDLPFPCTNAIYEERMASIYARAVAEGIHGVAFGDLFLEDIRAYRLRTLAPSGLEPIFPVWGVPTDHLATQMMAAGLKARITCLDPTKLPAELAGREWNAELLAELPVTVDPCGENGEFHTFAWSGPMFFSGEISVERGQIVHRDGFVYAELLELSHKPATHFRS